MITLNVKTLLLFGFVVLLRYKDQYTFQVMGGLAVTYLFLQTFAIPGSIFLSIVLGIQKIVNVLTNEKINNSLILLSITIK